MNNPDHLAERREYLIQLLCFQAAGKHIYYVDETNVNIWCSRSIGRSKRGTRACVVDTASRGANMHVIACISADGLMYWERRFGNYRAPDCKRFLWRQMDHMKTQVSLADAVIFMDNAPAHSGVEDVFQEEAYRETTLLRLRAYSPMLNPIENCFFSL